MPRWCERAAKVIISAETLSLSLQLARALTGTTVVLILGLFNRPLQSQPAVSHFIAGARPGRGPYVTRRRKQQRNQGPLQGGHRKVLLGHPITRYGGPRRPWLHTRRRIWAHAGFSSMFSICCVRLKAVPHLIWKLSSGNRSRNQKNLP